MGTRGPGDDRDYALYAMLISPNGMRSLFIADRLPTLREVNIAFAHVWQELGHEQGYLLAELIDPVFLVKSTGARLLDRLFDAIEPWLDGGADPMVALGNILLAEEACSVTCQPTSKTAPPLCIIKCYLQLVSRQDWPFPLSASPFRLIASPPVVALLGLFAIP